MIINIMRVINVVVVLGVARVTLRQMMACHRARDRVLYCLQNEYNNYIIRALRGFVCALTHAQRKLKENICMHYK